MPVAYFRSLVIATSDCAHYSSLTFFETPSLCGLHTFRHSSVNSWPGHFPNMYFIVFVIALPGIAFPVSLETSFNLQVTSSAHRNGKNYLPRSMPLPTLLHRIHLDLP